MVVGPPAEVVGLPAHGNPGPARPRRKRTGYQTPLRGVSMRAEASGRSTPASREAHTQLPSAASSKTIKWTTKTILRSTSTAAKASLLPSSERWHHETEQSATSAEPVGGDIAPDGSSAGREGRQFTVANVGNNGRIYLRPSVRPAHQRHPQPNFIFPMPPTTTTVVESWRQGGSRGNQVDVTGHDKEKDAASPQTAPWTPSNSASPITATGYISRPESSLHARLRLHRRAISDSTAHEASTVYEHQNQQRPHLYGTQMISKNADRDEQRPWTMDDLAAITGAPLLNVNIPSWRLGTPRFTLRGTPMLCGSSYAPTEEFCSSTVSGVNSLSRRTNLVLTGVGDVTAGRPAELTVPTKHAPISPPHGQPTLLPLRLSPQRDFLANTPTQPAITPSMFTDLTFGPACDDPSIVRYSPTQSVTAATPPRLVAEITSPSFLDYELISDFFLTFRSFMGPLDLLKMLVARLRWALDRGDETGMIVRVRTFVAIRHWILNYFVDDFLLEYDLRVAFCNLLNNFVEELSLDAAARRVQLKILTELKKSWRRVCAQYWDGSDPDDLHASEEAIMPGGAAEWGSDIDHANADDLGAGQAGPKMQESPPPAQAAPVGATQAFPRLRGEGRIPLSAGDFVVSDNHPATPVDEVGEQESPTSPQSLASRDIVSCSFPGKNLKILSPKMAHWMTAHPAPATATIVVGNSYGPIATTPKALMGKRVRAAQTHRRNNSSRSDSLRDHRSDSTSSPTGLDFPAVIQPGGSLVRGNLPPPSQAVVDIEPSGARRGGHSRRQTTLFRHRDRDLTSNNQVSGGAMSGYGMRRLLRSVRKVLKSRGQSLYTTAHTPNLNSIAPVGPQGATTNRLPGTAVVPQVTAVQSNGAGPPLRIDLLGAAEAEQFKRAIREDEKDDEEEQQEEEAAAPVTAASGISIAKQNREEKTETGQPQRQLLSEDSPHYALPSRSPDLAPSPSLFVRHHGSTFGMDPATFEVLTRQDQGQRPMSDMEMTIGSKSIVIVDGTVPFDMPNLHGSRRTENPSMDASLADSFVRGATDPTPPNTPPLQSAQGGTPQRSSHLFHQYSVIRRPDDRDVLPPFIPDLATLGGSYSRTASENPSQPSMPASRGSDRHPPLSGGIFRMQRNAQPPNSQQSLNSILFRRTASPRSPMVSPGLRSPDQVNTSPSQQSDVAMPAPLRTLRRRPGGNLKDAVQAGDLGQPVVRRSQSAASLATYSESMRSSYVMSSRPNSAEHYDASPANEVRRRGDVFSVGQLAEKPVKRNMSLFSTHSSRPDMRTSHDAAVQKLALIPDDEDDGVESALAKLEGKFPPKKPKLLSIVGQPSGAATREEREDSYQCERVSSQAGFSFVHPPEEGEDQEEEEKDVVEDEDNEAEDKGESFVFPTSQPSSLDDQPSLDHSMAEDPRHRGHEQTRGTQPSVRALSSFLTDESHDSYCSIPFLQRELDDESLKANPRVWAGRSVLCGVGDDDDEDDDLCGASVSDTEQQRGDFSFDFVLRTKSMEQIRPGQTIPPTTMAGKREHESFLNDMSVDDSDLSEAASEVDFWHREVEEQGRGVSNYQSLAHPPLASETTPTRALATSPGDRLVPALVDVRPGKSEPLPLPLTPDRSPVVACAKSPPSTEETMRTRGDGGQVDPLYVADVTKKAALSIGQDHSVHLPFILAFDSDVLAQQFTLIEKDALTEIDWKELIDMDQKECPSTTSRSWVDFLRNTDAQGVHVVIARFDIMVAWAKSEIVLTKHIEERARCIIKLIHIAAHCRKYRNFATMAQLTIALSSTEISRLTKTWELLPQSDLKTLQDLELLITPSRNFRRIRQEMETGTNSGCIPFVGIYTHDLFYNAQRPAEVASSRSTPPLVNFERCRCAASVVKTLLRLMESSARYTFEPSEGVTERCIWIGALSDSDIRYHSRMLE